MKYFITVIFLLTISASQAFAQGLGTLAPPPAANVNITTIITRFLEFAIISGVVVFFFLFMWGSIQWLTSEGEKGALTAAKARITSAAIGLVMLSSVWVIFEIVKSITYKP